MDLVFSSQSLTRQQYNGCIPSSMGKGKKDLFSLLCVMYIVTYSFKNKRRGKGREKERETLFENEYARHWQSKLLIHKSKISVSINQKYKSHPSLLLFFAIVPSDTRMMRWLSETISSCPAWRHMFPPFVSCSIYIFQSYSYNSIATNDRWVGAPNNNHADIHQSIKGWGLDVTGNPIHSRNHRIAD